MVKTSGITALYPRAWHASMEYNTLLIWSGGDPKHRSADFANHIPDGAVWIWLFNLGPMRRMNGFVHRPAHFELEDDDAHALSCGFGFVGWNVVFVDHGSAVQAFVGLGEGARNSDVSRLLDQLVITSPRVLLET